MFELALFRRLELYFRAQVNGEIVEVERGEHFQHRLAAHFGDELLVLLLKFDIFVFGKQRAFPKVRVSRIDDDI